PARPRDPGNANGVPSSSPGLRGTSYPAKSSGKIHNPTGLRPFVLIPQIAYSQNPVGVHGFVGRFSKSNRFASSSSASNSNDASNPTSTSGLADDKARCQFL